MEIMNTKYKFYSFWNILFIFLISNFIYALIFNILFIINLYFNLFF